MSDCGYEFPVIKDTEDPPPHMCLDTSDLTLPESNYPMALPSQATPTTRPPNQFVPPGYSNNITTYQPTTSGLDFNGISNPVLMDAFLAQSGKELAEIASAPIKDGNRMSREESVGISQGKICLLKTQEDRRTFYVELFNGYIKTVECVTFKSKLFFRLIFIIDGQAKIGEYHDCTVLNSAKKVGAILCEELTALEKRATDKSILSLIQMELRNLLSKKKDDYTSLQFGWSLGETDTNFTRQLPEELLAFSKFNKNLFLVTGDTPTEPDNLIQRLISSYNQIGNEKEASALLIFSFIAMLYSLIRLPLTDTVLVFLGNPYACKRIASHFMKAYVRRDNEDTISLSEDNRYVLRDYLTLLHDDVTIITDDTSSKYGREKLEDIYQYARSGECNGERIETLFAICSNELGSLNYDKQLFIHIPDNTKIDFQDSTPQIFRRFILEKIEEGSGYWCKRISEICRTNQLELGNGTDFIAASKTVCHVLSEILQSEGANKDNLADINRFFNLGLTELQCQIDNSEATDILSFFRNTVADSVSNGTMKVWNRKIKLDAKTDKIVFYDDNYYYFPTEVFTSICIANAIGKTSQFSLKGSLDETGVLHTYRYHKSKPDKGYDFRFFNENGLNVQTSGLAIYRSFWDDEPGSISLVDLYESMHKID